MTNPTRDGWGPCPRGTFVRLAADLAARRTRQLWLTGLGIAVGLVLTAAAGWQAAAAIDDWQQARRLAPTTHSCQPAGLCQPVTVP